MAHNDCFLFLCYFLCFSFILCVKHECERLCSRNEEVKICYYHFKIGLSRRNEEKGEEKSVVFLSINNSNPGPLISVCENDTITIDVENKLPLGLETSIHFHGLQGHSPYMDGVPMITQCPITPYTTFRYQFKASRSGTFFYHAHSVNQQLDGIHGPLIIRSEKNAKFLSKTILVSPQMTKLQSLESSFESDLNITGFRVNVFNDIVGESQDIDKLERVRIINAAAMNCPIGLYTHVVPLRVVAMDGNEVESSEVPELMLHPDPRDSVFLHRRKTSVGITGERIDLLIKPETIKMIHVVGHNLCEGHAKYGLNSGISEKTEAKEKVNFSNYNELLKKLKPEISPNLKKTSVKVFLPFDSSFFHNFNGSVDFRYKLGAATFYAPSVLSRKSVSLTQINKKSFLYPPSPLLSQPDDIPKDLICGLSDSSDRCLSLENGFCECLQILNLPFNKQIDLIIINEGKNDNKSQTIYIHGHSFYVLALKYFDRAITTAEIEEMETSGKIKRNLVNPVSKDTILIPNKGFAVLRLETKYQGKWLLESTTSKAKTNVGLEIVLDIEDPRFHVKRPKGFPTCRTMKEPDLVFSSD